MQKNKICEYFIPVNQNPFKALNERESNFQNQVSIEMLCKITTEGYLPTVNAEQ